MGLNLPPPPKKGLDIIRDALGSLVTQPESAAYAMAAEGTENIVTAAPHKIYFVGLEDIAAGRVLSAARFVGWRYIILSRDDPRAAAELSVDDSGGNLEFSQVNQGPYVGSTIEGFSFAEGLDEVQTNDYEVRLIKIPALYIIGLWLHGQAGEDLIIPLPPTRPELHPLTTYSEEDFKAAIQGAAARRLEFDETEQS